MSIQKTKLVFAYNPQMAKNTKNKITSVPNWDKIVNRNILKL